MNDDRTKGPRPTVPQDEPRAPEPHTMVVDAMPMQEDARRKRDEELHPPPGLTAFVPALAEGARVVLARPRVLLFLLLLSLLLPMAAVLPTWESAEQNLSAVTLPPSEDGPVDFLDGAPDWVMREWQARDPLGAVAGGHALAALALVSSLLGLVFSAGWMSFAARDRRAHGLASFLRSGGRCFFPFLRTWLLGLPLFFAWTWVCFEALAEWLYAQLLPDGDPALGASENTGRWLAIVQGVVYLWGLLKLEILLDLARASLVIGNRTSALLALARGFGFFLRRPLGVLGLVLLGLGIELLWVAGVHAAGLPLALVVVLLPLGRIVLRGARHAGLAFFYDSVVNPQPQPRNPRPYPHGDRGDWE
jgi:hypothetical protein